MESNNNKKLVKLDERVKQVGGTLIIKEAKVGTTQTVQLIKAGKSSQFAAQVEDSGKYLCMVNNSVGGESVETVLTVTGRTNSGWRPAHTSY